MWLWALRLTVVTPTLILLKRIIVFVPLFLPRVGICAPPGENESIDSGVAHSFDSGKNNGGVTTDVIRHWIAAKAMIFECGLTGGRE